MAGWITAGVNGCGGHPVLRKLQGRWLGDSIEHVDDSALAAATGWVKGTSLEFAGATLTVSIPAEEPRSGEFSVVHVRRNDVRLAVARKDGSVDHLSLKLDDERRMRWMLDDSRAIVMRREY
jgi:hypothetical protein